MVGKNNSINLVTIKTFLSIFLLAASVCSYGQLQFEDKTNSAGPFHTGESWGAAWGDLNGDVYPDLFVGNHRNRNSIYRNNGDGTFTDVVLQADLDQKWTSEPTSDIHGGSWADFDNDGDQDLFVMRSSKGARGQLFLNNGLGQFTERGGFYGIGPIGGGRLPVLFDYTGDGFLDLAITRSSDLYVFKQENGKFVNSTAETGMTSACLKNNFGIVSDLYDTGHLNYLCLPESEVVEKAFDTGTIPFTDVTTSIDHVGTYTDVALGDFNNDLKSDLFVLRGRVRPVGAQLISPNKIEAWISVGGLVEFEKSFTFKATGPITIDLFARNVAEPDSIIIGSSGYHPASLPFTLDPLDPNNWGTVANHNQYAVFVEYDQVAEEWTIYLSGGGNGNGSSEHTYFVVDGVGLTEPVVDILNGVDEDIKPTLLLNTGIKLENSGDAGIDEIMCGSVVAEDFDNDMDLDLYLVCRSSMENTENRIYLNDGTGVFTLSGTHGAEGILGAGLDSNAGTGEIAVSADYDVDGQMDVFVTNGNRLFPTFYGGPDQIFRNLGGNGNHWIEIDLQGINSNRDGFATKVIVTAGGISQLRERNGRYHRWSQDHQRLHFGLGLNTTATVTVEWPDGTTDVHNNVAVDKLYRATQDGTLTELTIGTPVVEYPAPVPGDECGEQAYDPLVDSGIFLYKDCTTGVWQLRAMSGGSTSTTNFTGTITSGQGFSNVANFSIEGSDVIDLSDPSQINFSLFMSGGGIDGFDFELLSGDACLTIDDPSGLQPLLGSGHIVSPNPMNLVTLEPGCQSGISIGDMSVSEGIGNADVTVSLSEASTSVVTVDYTTVDGSALSGSDYTLSSGTLTFNPGDTSQVISVAITSDSDVEVDETFTISLSNAANALITDGQGTVTIEDDEATACGEPQYNTGVDREFFLWQDCSGSGRWHMRTTAGGGAFVSYTGNVSTNQSITNVTPFSFEGSDAVDVSDPTLMTFMMSMSGTGQDGIDFDVASGNTCLTLDTPAGIDILVGEDRLAITPPFDIETLGACQSGISIGDVSVLEDVGTADVTVSLSEVSASVVTVDYTTVDGSALSGSDYTLSSGTLTFNPGDTSKVVSVGIVSDTQVEVDETFTISLSNAANALITDGQGTVTIEDDEATACGEPQYNTGVDREFFLWQDCSGSGRWHMRTTAGGGAFVSYTGNVSTNQSITNVTPFSFEGSDAVDVSDPTLMTFMMSMSGTGQDGIDFDVASGNTCLTLDTPAGIDILVGEDRLAITPPFDIETLGACQSGISIGDVSVLEDVGTADVAVSLSEVSTSVVTVDYTTVDGSALSGSDYTLSSGTLTFNPGDTSQVISVAITSDSDVEVDETFTISLSNAANALITDGQGTVTIEDDEATACGEPQYNTGVDREFFLWQDCSGSGRWHMRTTAGGGAFVSYTGNVSTNQSITNVTPFSFEGSDAVDVSDPTLMTFMMSMSGTGQDGIDFDVASGNTCLTLDTPAGIDILVGEDRLAITPPFDIETLGACQSGISIGDVSVLEDVGTADVTVSLSEVSASVVTVDYTTVDGSALSGSDYTLSSGTLTFNPGDTSKVVSVGIVSDTQVEVDETFTISLSNAANALITDGQGTVTIEDDEATACGEPQYNTGVDREFFLWQDCSGSGRWHMRTTAGGGAFVSYTGNVSTNQSITNVTPFSFEGSDAVDVSDPTLMTFMMSMSGTGQDGIDFDVASGNTCLTLDTPAGIDILVGEDRLAITPPFDIETLGACQSGISIGDVSVLEDVGTADVTVSLSEVSASVVTVDYTTVDGSALSGSDYTLSSGTLTFNPGDTSQVISVAITSDSDVEVDETFSIALSNAANALITDGQGTVTIEDDEVTACGEPQYDRTSDREFFLWQDCSGSGSWHIRTTAGGGIRINYTASLVSNQLFTNVTPYSFEGSDFVDTSTPGELTTTMTMANTGEDGIDFDVASGATCLTLDAPAGIDILVGEDRMAITPPFDIETLGPCI